MILNASSVDGEETPSISNPEFLKLFNTKSAGAAGKLLHSFLMDYSFDCSTIAAGAIQAMYYGDFMCFHLNEVKDFCAYIQEGSVLSWNQVETFMILHMSDTFGSFCQRKFQR